MTLKKQKRIFSQEEADALLPELERHLKRLRHKKEVYRRTHDALFFHELVCVAEKEHGLWDSNDGLESGLHALEEAIEELAKDMEEVFAMGVILRNLEQGQVDLRGKLNGQEVYFSWKTGEARIQFYRLRGEALAYRRAIPA